MVEDAPPAWLGDRAVAERWPPDAVEKWRAALIDNGVAEVALMLDVRGETVDFGGKTAQTVNADNAQPLHSALGRGLDRSCAAEGEGRRCGAGRLGTRLENEIGRRGTGLHCRRGGV